MIFDKILDSAKKGYEIVRFGENQDEPYLDFDDDLVKNLILKLETLGYRVIKNKEDAELGVPPYIDVIW